MRTLIQRLQHDHLRRLLKRAISLRNRACREEGRKIGFEEGFKEGFEEGFEEGLRLGLIDVVTAHFGPPPADAKERILAATPEEFQRWMKRLWQVKSIDELLG